MMQMNQNIPIAKRFLNDSMKTRPVALTSSSLVSSPKTFNRNQNYHPSDKSGAVGAREPTPSRVPLANVQNISDKLVVVNKEERSLTASFATMAVKPSTKPASVETMQPSTLPTRKTGEPSGTNAPGLVECPERQQSKGDYISSFLHCVAERAIPPGIGVSVEALEEWVASVLHVLAQPSSPEAKYLMKHRPQAVLFAQQLQLANVWSGRIEDMAQRAASRDYYYDFLMRMYGHTRAKSWITGREEGDGRRRMCAQKGSLSMRKKVLIGQGYKAHHESVLRQTHTAATTPSVIWPQGG